MLDRTERKRLTRNAQRVLERLREGKATNEELLPIGGFRYGARVQDLRDAGFIIDSAQVKGGLWSFELRSEPHAQDAA